MNREALSARLRVLQKRYATLWPLFAGCLSLAAIFFLGVVMYMQVEGWPFLDAFYMVVLALSTVGFQEVHPLSETGRLITSVLILLGVGNFAYLVGSFTQILVEGRLQRMWGRLKVQKTIDKLNDHYIVCGYGRIGAVVARELKREGLDVVVIESDPPVVDKIRDEGILHVAGDATGDSELIAAGLVRARAIIVALSQDAANVYVTLTARQLKPDIHIIARANSETHVARLERAGANRVLLPHLIGGMRMAQSVLRPTVTDFLELAVRGQNLDLQMEELKISPVSGLVGKDLVASQIRPRFNLIIITIKKANGEMIFNPGPETVLAAHDTLVAVGRKENLAQLQDILLTAS